jgi:tetratricopeptide (TPR) repeat protein
MLSRPCLTLITAAALQLAAAGTVLAQRPVSNVPAAPLRMELTSSSEQARTLFRDALFQAQNVDAPAARRQLAAASAADPQFGLAHVYAAFLSTGTAAERERAVATALAGMGAASVPEMLLALYWREAAAGRGPAAIPVLQTLVELVPGDADVAYILLGPLNAGKPPAEQAANGREFLRKYPQHAAAHNTAAYVAWSAGDPAAALASVQEYERLAPNHYNAHDSYADILILLRRPQEALPHVHRELEIAPGDGTGRMKLGTIRLMLGDVAAARNEFATGLAAATTPAQRFDFMHWTAVAHLYARDGKSALGQLTQIATDAAAANADGAAATAHERAGVVEAYVGNRRAVAAHFTAATAADAERPAAHYLWKAVAFSKVGDAAAAREALTRYSSMPGYNAALVPVLDALLALDARDLPAAKAALAQAETKDLLTKAVTAELMFRDGQRAEGAKLRAEALASTVKIDGNPQVNFVALVGRLRAEQIR